MIFFRGYLNVFLTSLLFLYAFIASLYPVYYNADTDLFWHIKSGEVIFKNIKIPEADSFAYTPKDSVREQFILNSYWLSQIILYLFYKSGHFTGIVLLRALAILSALFFIYSSILRRGFLTSIVLSLLFLEIFRGSSVKPNLFSYPLLAALLYFMEKYRNAPDKRYGIFVFLIMMLWANMHGSYIIGTAVLFIYLLSAAAVFILKRKNPADVSDNSEFLDEKKRALAIIKTSVIAVLATLITPSGISTYLVTLKLYTDPTHNWILSHVLSHNNILDFARHITETNDTTFLLSLIVSAFVLICTVFNITRKRAGGTETLIVLFLLILAVDSVRMISFFLIAGLILSVGKDRYNMFPQTIYGKLAPAFLIMLLIVLSFLLYKRFPVTQPGEILETRLINLGVSDFLAENGIKGNMLNQSSTGNTFILKLTPQYKVFTSTRFLNYEVYKDSLHMFGANISENDALYNRKQRIGFYLKMLKGDVNGDFNGEYWHSLLESYEIDFIVGSVTQPGSGEIYFLFLKLIYDERWVFVYRDGNSVVFVKDNGKNEVFLGRNPPLDKSAIFDEIIMENSSIHTTTSLEAGAFAYAMKGNYDKAEIILERIIDINKKRLLSHLILSFVLQSKGVDITPDN